MTTLRGRDKRAQRLGTVAAKRKPDIWESAPQCEPVEDEDTDTEQENEDDTDA